MFFFSVKNGKSFLLSITEEMFSVSKAIKAYVDEMPLGQDDARSTVLILSSVLLLALSYWQFYL